MGMLNIGGGGGVHTRERGLVSFKGSCGLELTSVLPGHPAVDLWSTNIFLNSDKYEPW